MVFLSKLYVSVLRWYFKHGFFYFSFGKPPPFLSTSTWPPFACGILFETLLPPKTPPPAEMISPLGLFASHCYIYWNKWIPRLLLLQPNADILLPPQRLWLKGQLIFLNLPAFFPPPALRMFVNFMTTAHLPFVLILAHYLPSRTLSSIHYPLHSDGLFWTRRVIFISLPTGFYLLL